MRSWLLIPPAVYYTINLFYNPFLHYWHIIRPLPSILKPTNLFHNFYRFLFDKIIYSDLFFQSLCLWIGRDPTLLPVFFCVSQEDQGPAGFLLFSLLLSYVYRDGQVGNRARDSLLLIFSHSARCDEVSEYITNNSNFCPVLAAGLSGLYRNKFQHYFRHQN